MMVRLVGNMLYSLIWTFGIMIEEENRKWFEDELRSKIDELID